MESFIPIVKKHENNWTRPALYYWFSDKCLGLGVTASTKWEDLNGKLNAILALLWPCWPYALRRFIIRTVIWLPLQQFQASQQQLAGAAKVKDKFLLFFFFELYEWSLNKIAKEANCQSHFIYFLISHLYNFHTYSRKCTLVTQWHLAAFPSIIQ